MNKKTIIAYIAGIIDGEGCITITRRRIRRLKTNNWYYEPQVIVCNTNRALIYFCVNYYSGWMATSKNDNPNWATVYRWIVTGDKMRCLLNDVIPYLIIKRKEANLVLLFPNYKGNGRKARTDTEKQEQKSLWLAIKRLNSG